MQISMIGGIFVVSDVVFCVFINYYFFISNENFACKTFFLILDVPHILLQNFHHIFKVPSGNLKNKAHALTKKNAIKNRHFYLPFEHFSKDEKKNCNRNAEKC